MQGLHLLLDFEVVEYHVLKLILLDLVYRNIELFKHAYGNPMQEVTLSQKNLPQLKDLNKFLDLHRLAWI